MKYRANQYKKTKQPIMPAWMVAEFYFSIVIAVIVCGLFAKANHKLISPVQQAHAQTVGSFIPTKVGRKVVLPTVTPTPYQYDTEGAIKRIWGKDYKIGLAISSCESGTNPDKYNVNTDGSIDFSVFQINTVHGIILDPEENIRYAYSLYQEQNTTPWNSSKKCWEAKL
jgi:hypothetical protein